MDMKNPVKKDWLTLPDLVLSDIMKKIALESISTLRNCAEVCRRWEQEIMSNPVIQDIARTKTMTARMWCARNTVMAGHGIVLSWRSTTIQ